MAQLIIYYDKQCSKSQKALTALQRQKNTYKVISYLDDGLNPTEIKYLFDHYQGNREDLIRWKEPECKTFMQNKSKAYNTLFDLLTSYPKCLQRPLIIKNDTVIIARDEANFNLIYN